MSLLPSSAQLNPTPTSVGWAEIALISTFTPPPPGKVLNQHSSIQLQLSLKPAWAELGTAQSQLVYLLLICELYVFFAPNFYLRCWKMISKMKTTSKMKMIPKIKTTLIIITTSTMMTTLKMKGHQKIHGIRPKKKDDLNNEYDL